jgi:hypothetical protein
MTKVISTNVDTAQEYQDTLEKVYLLPTASAFDTLQDDVDDVQVSIVGLTAGQIGGIIVFETRALLYANTPDTAQKEQASYKVTLDPDPSLNGFYSWVTGTTYRKDADTVENIIDPNNTSEGVSGSAVSDFAFNKVGSSPILNIDSIDLSALTYTDNNFIDGGVLTSFSGVKVSAFLAVLSNQDYLLRRLYSYNAHLSYFDESFVYISDIDGSFPKELNFKTPANAKYIRFNVTMATPTVTLVTNPFNLDYIEQNITVPKEGLEGLIAYRGYNYATGATFGDAGFYLNASGVLTALSGSAVSSFIQIESEKSYLYVNENPSYTIVANFYDEYFSRISSYSKSFGDTTNPVAHTSPANAKYVKINRFYNSTVITLYPNINTSYFDLPWLKLSSADEGLPTPQTLIPMSTRDRNTFVGATNYVVDKILDSLPAARIVFVTHYAKDTRTQLVNVQKAIANYWSFKLVNLADNLGYVQRDGNNLITDLIPDGVHPAGDFTAGNSANIDRIAAYIAKDIAGVFLSWSGKKVSWHGTSIPAGYPFESEDNAQYPILAVEALGGTCVNLAKSSSLVRLAKYDGTANPENGARDQFSNDTASYQTGRITYFNSIIPLIGTANEPDLIVLDFGYNDYYSDSTDFDLMDI